MPNYKMFKGISFETLVGIALKDLCLEYNWKLLSDVRLRSLSERGYTQIDFLVFTPHKYFCIETKDWNCTVVCSYDRYWTAKYDRIVKTLNPVVQNKNHMSKLCKLIPPSRVDDIVCFSDDTTLENRIPGVVNFSEMLMLFRSMGNTKGIISREELDAHFAHIARESSTIKLEGIDMSII